MSSMRARYSVWVQADPPSGGKEYAAKCVDCPPNKPNGEFWVCDMAGTREEAWDLCWEHEEKHHRSDEGHGGNAPA